MDKLKTLREITGISIMECKKALDEANGDLEKAKTILKARGIEIAAKNQTRETGSGRLFSYVHHNGKVASLVELLCETDFVDMNENFKALGTDIAMQAAVGNYENNEDLLASDYIKDGSKTVEALIKEHVFSIGENISLGRFVVYSL